MRSIASLLRVRVSRLLAFAASAAVCGAVATAQVTRTLTVGSMPYEPLGVQVSPSDLDGAGGGVCGFTRRYADGTVVTLQAPASDGSHTFMNWIRDGADYSTDASTTVTMDADHVMTARYFANSQVLANGSFENGYEGWDPQGNHELGSDAGVATDGSAWVAFNAGQKPPNGVLAQTFATTPGLSYTLSYHVGTLSYNTSQQALEYSVEGAAALLSGVNTVTGAGGGAVQWSSVSHEFTADDAATTLTFRDVSQTSDAVDLYLDNVQVYLTPSEPPAAPLAADDAATIHSGQKVRLAVLANDTGLMNQNTLEIVAPPAVGTATVDPGGEILYAHDGSVASPVSFTYRVSGEGGTSEPATVQITISSELRIPNGNTAMPAEPPVTAVRVVPAFPGLTFTEPLCLVSPPGDASRLFVCERGGRIMVIPDVTATPEAHEVIDLAQVVANPPRNPVESWDPGAYEESGLLGMAFHPDFAANGFFYVSYLVRKSTDPGALYQRLSRFTVPPAETGAAAPVANPLSELVLIEQRDRADGHNGSDIHFGADGYLYWALGDETNPNDIYGNSQHIEMNFFGGLLRIDVDRKPGNLEPNAHPNPDAAALGYSSTNSIPRDEVPAGSGIYQARYSIPIDNPFVHVSEGGAWDGTFNGSAIPADRLPYVRSEYYAVGLRSPWRFYIDGETGEIWLGDVGQDLYEELNLIVKGGNYGWPVRDGLHAGPKPALPGGPFIDPIHEYNHGTSENEGRSIIGGVIYRGARFGSLAGAYIFGDNGTGNIWALRRPGGVVSVERIAGLPDLSTFGTDPSNGDVLVTDYSGGRVMRIVTSTPDLSFPATLKATGLFADVSDLSPAPGVLPYEPNLRFWSDHAVKSRWFSIPDAGGRMTWARDDAWGFPSGEVWVKHFELETERGNPDSPKKRIETRVLVKNDSGIYGVSYRWNDEGTQATLARDGGEVFPVEVMVNGEPYVQQWGIPSRSQCVTCHSPQAGYALSFNTRQLNLERTIHGFSGNQLDLFHEGGYFQNAPLSPNLLPRHVRPDETSYSIEARVRSYLAVNCAYCHAGSSGTAPTAWDVRHELTLDETGIVNGATGSAGGDFRLIVPGDTAHSVMLQRMGATGGFTRMPPLGTNEIDAENVALVTEWINQSLTNHMTYAEWRLDSFGSSSSPEGEPFADFDGDGADNWTEFLAGTLAANGGSRPVARVSRAGGAADVTFFVPENRSAQVETSIDLVDWTMWDVPGNDGIPKPEGETAIHGPAEDAARFFRVRFGER